MNIWFWADLHLGHTGILKPDKDLPARGKFSNIDEMDEFIMDMYSETVKSDKDKVYLLGDFIWSKRNVDDYFIKFWAKKAKGKIILVPGNHDEKMRKKLSEYIQLTERLEHVKINNKWLILCHYPLEVWYKHLYGSYHFHGHCHGTLENRWKRVDVGFDVFPAPVNYDQLEWFF